VCAVVPPPGHRCALWCLSAWWCADCYEILEIPGAAEDLLPPKVFHYQFLNRLSDTLKS